MRRVSGLLFVMCFVLLAASPAMSAEQSGVMRAEGVIEKATEGGPEKPVDEFADERKVTLTRKVTESDYKGIGVVNLEIPEAGDGFDQISVDKATELGRELLKICPDGSTCRINGIIVNGTFTRIYSIQRVKE